MPYTRDEGIWSKRNWIFVIGLVAGIANLIFGITIEEGLQVEIANTIESVILVIMALAAKWSKRAEKTKLEE